MPVSRLRKNRSTYPSPKTSEPEPAYDMPVVVKWFNYLAWVISLWFFIHPGDLYGPLVWSVLAFPVVGLILNGALSSRPVADVLCKKVRTNKGTTYNVIGYIMMPAVALLVRALIDVDFVVCSNLWFAMVGCFVLMAGLLRATHAPFRHWVRMVWMGVFLLMYSFGAAVHIDTMADGSKPTKYPVTILDKRVHKGSKSTTYYILVSQWPGHADGMEISETKDLYYSAAIGQQVYIYHYPGFLGIPWYYLNK